MKLIKHPVNFIIGIFCILCFISNVVNEKDNFLIALTGITAVANITLGFIDG